MKKTKQIAKLFILFLGVILLFKNCEKSDELIIEKNNNKISNFSKIPFLELPQELLPDVQQLKKASSTKSKSSTDNLILDTNQIIRLVDSLDNIRYSIKFTIKNQPYNVLYNLILGKDSFNTKREPFIIKYTIDNYDEVYINGKYDFSKMKGRIAIYKYYPFLNYLDNLKTLKNKKTEDSEEDPCSEYDNTGGSSSGGNAGSGSASVSGNPKDDENAVEFENSNAGEGSSNGDSTTCNVLLWYGTNTDLDNLFGISWSCTDGTKGNADVNKSAKTDNLDCPEDGEIPINEGDDDQIFNELTGEENCVYTKLKNLNLFKTTIKKFENNKNYNVIIKRGNCKNSNTGCTDGKDISNGNITITMGEGVNGNPLGFASNLLHEGIHAEIFKYVDERIKGIDPNDRKNLMYYYWLEKQKGDPRYFDANYQHQHMADKYIKPITEALRKLDNYSYTSDYYLGFAWTGLHAYGFDKYWKDGKLVKLTKEMIAEYEAKSGIVKNNTKFNVDDCK